MLERGWSLGQEIDEFRRIFMDPEKVQRPTKRGPRLPPQDQPCATIVVPLGIRNAEIIHGLEVGQKPQQTRCSSMGFLEVQNPHGGEEVSKDCLRIGRIEGVDRK